MAHRVVVLGAGYAGLIAAGGLARRLDRDRAEVTVVNPTRRFVERVRLHQFAAGQEIPRHTVPKRLRHTDFVEGTATAVDPDRRGVVVDTGAGTRTLEYDTLVYAPGSTDDLTGFPGAEHALTLADHRGADRLRTRLTALAAERATLTVVGGGSTGIETATELAESHPTLRVRLLTPDPLGAWLSEAARTHLHRVFDRLGVETDTTAKAVAFHPGSVTLADGREVPTDAIVWTAGFRAPALARAAGLAVDARDRVLVDEHLRSMSHPDIHAAGDAAAAQSADGTPLRMACATALPTGKHVADVVAARITGNRPRPLRFRYHAQCLSLGRRDGLIQVVTAEDSPRERVFTGRTGALMKEAIVRSAAAAVRHF